MKYEWKKQEKDIYAPKEEPTIVDIKEANFICIDGKGNPNNEDFQKRIEVLYTLSYAIRMSPRKGINIRSEEHTSELQSRPHLVCRLLLEKKKKKLHTKTTQQT